MIAPSLIPKRSGVQRKHDKRDATDLARLYRAGELVAVRIPSEADERVRDVVRATRSDSLSALHVAQFHPVVELGHYDHNGGPSQRSCHTRPD